MITFKTLSWKNFLSTGNYKTTLDLTRHNNTLVSGENGAGKSTMLDALTFALFGKSFRGITLPQLANSINEKDCEVEIEFSVGSTEYRVIRGISPKKFEIYKDGVLIPQEAKSKDYQKYLEDQIIKMSYKSFCQVVILGSSNYVPFMQLSTSDRRSVVENLLDIDVFSTMNVLVKARLQMLKEQSRDIEVKIEISKDKVETKKNYIDSLQKKSQASVDKFKEEIEVAKGQVDTLNEQISSLEKSRSELIESIADETKVTKTLSKMESLQNQLSRKSTRVSKEISFYEDNNTCPTCEQVIQSDHKNKMVQNKNTELESIHSAIDELKSNIDETSKREKEIQDTVGKIKSLEVSISEKRNSVSVSNKYIDKIQNSINDVLGEETELSTEKDDLKVLITEGKTHLETHKEIVEDKHYYALASTLLKDTGIKSKIIRHYLPVMNKLINKFLADMDFFCHFELDENFNETIKSRHRDEFSYHSFSEGERLRIDLSLLLAWREIARLKNSVNCNLLILDEVFDSSLDAVGTEEFLKLLTSFGDRANIFVISHKSDSMTDKFQNHIVFEKKNNFSKIK